MDSTRTPSISAQSGMRGRLPVDSTITSASSTWVEPSIRVASTWWADSKRAVPWTRRTRWLVSRSVIDRSRRPLMSVMRERRASKSSSTSTLARPISAAWFISAMAPPVAIMAFDGMQSSRWAAPPTMSRSTRVTSAPKRAA